MNWSIIQVYNQKMKHLLYEQQNMIATIKADNEQALKLQREQFSKREGELVYVNVPNRRASWHYLYQYILKYT